MEIILWTIAGLDFQCNRPPHDVGFLTWWGWSDCVQFTSPNRMNESGIDEVSLPERQVQRGRQATRDDPQLPSGKCEHPVVTVTMQQKPSIRDTIGPSAEATQQTLQRKLGESPWQASGAFSSSTGGTYQKEASVGSSLKMSVFYWFVGYKLEYSS